MSAMKILITGGSGFLGRNLTKYLQQQGHQIMSLSSKEFDLTDPLSLQKIQNPGFDQIYHLAAWTQAGDFCLHHAGEQWIINQKINTNVLAWWQKYSPQAKMVAMGTSASYSTESNLIETKYLEGLPNDKFYAYAMSKRMLLVGLESLHKQFGLDYLYVIPSTIFGPDYHTDNRQMHFIYDLIRKILLGKMNNTPVILWGDGYQERELIYIDDFVKLLYSLNQVCSNEIFNIASGKSHTIREFAEIICGIVGYDSSKIQYDVAGYVGARSKVLNIDKLSTKINIEQLPLIAGIENTVHWMQQEFLKNNH